MATTGLRLHFTNQKNKKKKSQTGIPELVKATENVTVADAPVVSAELDSLSKKKGIKRSSYNTIIPSRVEEEVEKYADRNETQAAIDWFKSKYPQYTFLCTSINNWKIFSRG